MSDIQSITKRNIKALILVGKRDFGRCPLASCLPTALWPVMGKSALERLLEHLADQGIEKVVICSEEDGSQLTESIKIDNDLKVRNLDKPLPVGTAGCIREAANGEADELCILFSASLICPPDIDFLISEHNKSNSDLTVVLNKANPDDCNGAVRSCGIYVYNSSVLEYIPEDGYFDIKEGLIPKILRAGKDVHTVILPYLPGNYRNGNEYLKAVTNNIEKIAVSENLQVSETSNLCTLWKGVDTQIDPTARITGQVIVMDGAKISQDAVVIGPSVLGKNVTIGKDSVIINSVLWDGVNVSSNCYIDNCVLDYDTYLPAYANALEKSFTSRQAGSMKDLNRTVVKNGNNKRSRLKEIFIEVSQQSSKWFKIDSSKIIKIIALVLVLVAFIWSYWSGFKELWNTWLGSDEYSSGLLVPFLAIYVLWLRKEEISKTPIKYSIFGLLLFIFAQAMRIFGLFFLFGSAERLSIVFSISAIVFLLFGWKLFRKVATILLFLVLMLPWPNRIHAAVSLPLQDWSTSSAVFCLELMGFDILREGNVIHIGQSTVAVAEACNGLRMITAFFVISGLVVLIVNRAWWEKLIVLISSLPIALMCNTLRLTITAIFFTVLEGEYWEKVFHDFGGYAMMPLALMMIVVELWLITKLTVPPEKKEEIIIVRQKR